MNDWIQRRRPDEVPTPVAVAVSDFCRRARQAASAAEVREALSYLSEEEDFRAREVAGGEPQATPLGPFAVVDLARGASPELAAQRQGCGYYDLVRRLAPNAAAPAEPAAPEKPTAPARQPSARANKKAAKTPEPTLAEKIAPKKRAQAEAGEPEGEAPAEAELSQKRQLPAPRGRFTRLASTKHPLEELYEAAAKATLATLIEQHGTRAAMVHALCEQYTGRGGAVLSMPELEAVLDHHGLSARLASRERELILSAYKEHRGASGRVAWALGMSPAELDRLVKASGLAREVEELRERYKREALSPDLRYRLDLLGRTRYLADLGIKSRFMDRLTSDLRALLEGCLEGASDFPGLVQAAARKHGLAPELLARAADKLGLAEPLTRRLPTRAADSVT